MKYKFRNHFLLRYQNVISNTICAGSSLLTQAPRPTHTHKRTLLSAWTFRDTMYCPATYPNPNHYNYTPHPQLNPALTQTMS